MVDHLNATLIDARLSANSRVPQWRKAALVNLLGSAYVHLPQFGNINYKNGGPIQIYSFLEGMAELNKLQPPFVVMCACKEYGRCHRKELAERFALMGLEVKEIKAWNLGKL